MKHSYFAKIVGFALLILPFCAYALDLDRYVGYQIIYSGTVTGYIDEDGKEQDDFEGCEYDRVLIIDYSKAITCTEYSYSYSYHPEIVILSNGSLAVAIIDNDIYSIRLN